MSDAGSNVELFQTGAMIGAALPLVTAVFTQERLTRRGNAVIAVALAVIAAVAVVGLRDRLTPAAVGTTFLATYVTAVAFYLGLWKPTGIARAIERRTSPRRRTDTRRLAASMLRPVTLERGIAQRTADSRSDLSRC